MTSTSRSSTAAIAITTAMAIAIAISASACGDRVTIGEIIDDPGAPANDAAADAAKPGPVVDGGDPGDSATEAGGYQPCAGKVCGSQCSACPPGDPSCLETGVVKACDAQGACRPDTPTCGANDGGGAYVPCEGKACGAGCTLCNPADLGCVETAVVKSCNAAGMCSASSPGC